MTSSSSSNTNLLQKNQIDLGNHNTFLRPQSNQAKLNYYRTSVSPVGPVGLDQERRNFMTSRQSLQSELNPQMRVNPSHASTIPVLSQNVLAEPVRNFLLTILPFRRIKCFRPKCCEQEQPKVQMQLKL